MNVIQTPPINVPFYDANDRISIVWASWLNSISSFSGDADALIFQAATQAAIQNTTPVSTITTVSTSTTDQAQILGMMPNFISSTGAPAPEDNLTLYWMGV